MAEREGEFIHLAPHVRSVSFIARWDQPRLGRSLARPLTLSSNNPKPKWGSKPHLRSLWLHSISPLISDPPHKLLRERASERASDMKRFSTLLVTPSPTARGERERAGERACLSDGWMERCNNGSGVVHATAKNEPPPPPPAPVQQGCTVMHAVVHLTLYSSPMRGQVDM